MQYGPWVDLDDVHNIPALLKLADLFPLRACIMGNAAMLQLKPMLSSCLQPLLT